MTFHLPLYNNFTAKYFFLLTSLVRNNLKILSGLSANEATAAKK